MDELELARIELEQLEQQHEWFLKFDPGAKGALGDIEREMMFIRDKLEQLGEPG